MKTAYSEARELYGVHEVDTETALSTLQSIPISIHCWQGDDVGGFEKPEGAVNQGGLQVTGNHPGKARSIDELRMDFEKVLTLVPGRHRMNLHACYADLGSARVDRDQYTIEHFASWVEWASSLGIGLDFNPTFFAHPKAADGFTLSHRDAEVRDFWIAHGRACRCIAGEIGRRLGSDCVNNVWIPDGFKDSPADRLAPRERLLASLDEIFSDEVPNCLDAVESKLFGIGSESYVVGSLEFYFGYAVSRQMILCLDAGHFHPTESMADKISSAFLYLPRLLLHVSRGIRWDSDHVVILDDPTRAIAEELVRGGFLHRSHIGLDFFDASINRVAGWVIGTRSIQKALLLALLEPSGLLRDLENTRDFTGRLALLENWKSMPFGAVWEEFCLRNNAPGDQAWIEEIRKYERAVLLKRI